MVRKRNIDPYIYHGKDLSPRRKEYNKEVLKAYNRIKSWERKYGFSIELPTPPSRATAKEIQKIKDITKTKLTNIPKRQAEFARKHLEKIGWKEAEKYGYQGEALLAVAETYGVPAYMVAKHPELLDLWYEQERRIDAIQAAKSKEEREWQYFLNPDISPEDFSEDEYYNTKGEGFKAKSKEPERTEPIVSEAEIQEFLERVKHDLTDYYDKVHLHSNYWSYRWNMQLAIQCAERIEANFDALLNQSNLTALYKYLSRPEIANRLNDLTNRLYKLESDNKTGDAHNSLLAEIFQLINGGAFSDEQRSAFEMGEVLDFSNFDVMD